MLYRKSTPQMSARNTKQDKGKKSMICALYVLWLAKSKSRDEATLNSEKIKPVALSIVELCLAEGIS